jgi:hypothetical protein
LRILITWGLPYVKRIRNKVATRRNKVDFL